MSTRVYINSISTVVPPHDFQSFFNRFIPLFLPQDQQMLSSRILGRTGINHRYSVLPFVDQDEHFYSPIGGKFPSTEKRMVEYEKHAPLLAVQAVHNLLTDEIRRHISHVIVGSCTGFSAPGVDCHVIKEYGLSLDTKRKIIGFMGCYAGLSVLQTAADIVRSHPSSVVLTINVELSSLHLQIPASIEQMMGSAQFGDGCAAAIVSAQPTGLEIFGFNSKLFPKEEKAIRWNITDYGYRMHLDQQLPKIIGENVLPIVMPNPSTGRYSNYDLFAIHPGGKSILNVTQRHLGLDEREMRPSKEVLENFGNMSSATILFVLKSIMDSNQSGNGIAIAFGPGLAVESMEFVK